MKLTTRGFTLVELMIVIAIIGVLAAALFPSMTGYLKRSRDTARQAGMKDITSALGAYYADKEAYPAASASGCVNSAATALSTTYMPKGVPVDPTASARDNGCGSYASAPYGYGSGTIAGSPSFIISSMLENDAAGNTGATVTALKAVYVTTTFSLTSAPTTSKGTGSGYIMVN